MSESPATRRRWLQFGLGSLLWLTAVVALSIFGITEHLSRRHAERVAAEQGSRADNYARDIEAMQLNVLAELRATHAAESRLDKLMKNGTANQESDKAE